MELRKLTFITLLFYYVKRNQCQWHFYEIIMSGKSRSCRSLRLFYARLLVIMGRRGSSCNIFINESTALHGPHL